MNQRLAISGVGLTRHCAFPVKQTWKEMLGEAVIEALRDSGLTPDDIDGGVVAYHGEGSIETGDIGPMVADWLGIAPRAITGMSAACSGGAVALYHACALVASGMCEVALAAGFEKGSDLYEYVESISVSSEVEYDYHLGLTHLDWLALMTRRYAEKFEVDVDAFVCWVEQRHEYARLHSKSFYYGQSMLSRDELRGSLLYLGAARADGAAAAIITSPERAAKLRSRPVFIDGIGYASGSAYLPHKFGCGSPQFDICDSAVTRAAAQEAFRRAGLKSPATASVIQVSDAVPAVAFMELEALGLYPAGGAWKGVLEGTHGRGGRYPTNTHGGSIAFGHASGASALVNVIETTQQLRGDAGPRQIDGDLREGICQSCGGANNNNTVTVLRKE